MNMKLKIQIAIYRYYRWVLRTSPKSWKFWVWYVFPWAFSFWLIGNIVVRTIVSLVK